MRKYYLASASDRDDVDLQNYRQEITDAVHKYMPRATLNDFALRKAQLEDAENMSIILSAAKTADVVIYAPGVGKAKNKLFQESQKQVLEALKPEEHKLFCLCDARGNARLQHPLSPAVRTWELSPLKIEELVKPEEVKLETPKKLNKLAKKEAPEE